METMTAAVSKEVREKIVQAYNKGGRTQQEISEIFGVSLSSVQKYLKKYRETGDLEPCKQPGRPPTITDSELQLIKEIVETNPDGRLIDYRDELYRRTNISVTFATIHNACNELNLRRKKRVFTHQSKKEQMCN